MENELMIKNENFNGLSKIANEVFEENYLQNKIVECYGREKARGQMIAWGNVFSNLNTQYVDKFKTKTLGQAINQSDRLKRQLIEEISKLMEKGVEMDSRNFYCAPHDLGKANEKLEINFMVGYKKDILHKMGVFIVNMGVVYAGDEYEIRQNEKGQQYPYHNCKNISKVMEATKATIGNLCNIVKFGYVCYKYKEEQRILVIPKEQIIISLKKTADDKNFSIKLNALGVYGAIEVILWKKLFNEVIYGDIAYNYEFEKETLKNQKNAISQEEYYAKIRAEQENKKKQDEQIDINKNLSNIKQADQLNNADDATTLINETQNFKKILEVIKKENEKDMITLNAIKQIKDIEAIAQDYIDSDHRFSQKAFLVSIIQRIKLEKLTPEEQFRYCGTPLADADKFNGYQL